MVPLAASPFRSEFDENVRPCDFLVCTNKRTSDHRDLRRFTEEVHLAVTAVDREQGAVHVISGIAGQPESQCGDCHWLHPP